MGAIGYSHICRHAVVHQLTITRYVDIFLILMNTVVNSKFRMGTLIKRALITSKTHNIVQPNGIFIGGSHALETQGSPKSHSAAYNIGSLIIKEIIANSAWLTVILNQKDSFTWVLNTLFEYAEIIFSVYSNGTEGDSYILKGCRAIQLTITNQVCEFEI